MGWGRKVKLIAHCAMAEGMSKRKEHGNMPYRILTVLSNSGTKTTIGGRRDNG
jgi:hypothetical protein